MNTNKFYNRLSEEVMILLQVKRSKVCLEMPVDLLMICLSKEEKEVFQNGSYSPKCLDKL